jgi:hypothetical protein
LPQRLANLLSLILSQGHTTRDVKTAARNSLGYRARHPIEETHPAQHRLFVHRPEKWPRANAFCA